MTGVVGCTAVSRNFGHFAALEGVSVEIHEGEIFGIVGPNGAGKTTLLNCLEGLDRPTSGHVEVLGLDPLKDRHSLALQVGVQRQSAALPPDDARDRCADTSGAERRGEVTPVPGQYAGTRGGCRPA